MAAPRGATRHAGRAPRDAPRIAYAHGRAGRNAPEWATTGEHAQSYAAGKQWTAQQTASPVPVGPSPGPPAPPRAPSTPTLTRGPGPGRSIVPTGAGPVLLGVLSYAVGINYLRAGTPGVRAWLSAKFLNRTPTDPGAAGGFPAPVPFYNGTPGHTLPLIPGLSPGPYVPPRPAGKLPTIPGLTP